MIGEPIEQLYGAAVLPNGTNIGEITFTDDVEDGQWLVLFFIPAAFTWVCPTEFNAIKAKYNQFEELNTVVWGISTDGIEVQRRWIKEAFGTLPYSLLSDRNWSLSAAFGCLDEEEGVSYRCTVIIDGNGFIRHYSVNDNNVGRNIDEILRLIRAFQESDLTGKVAPCEWCADQEMITPGGEE
jgi:alkyl hydroperoxide reductase subunit AhpC